MSAVPDSLARRLDRLQRTFLLVGLVAGVLGAVGAWLSPRAFFQAYLVGYMLFLGIALGCIGLTMLHHLVGGLWGFAIRRPMEAGATTLWLLALLFVPIVLGMRYLYPWTDPSLVAHDLALKHKSPYLNTAAFLYRAVGYFVVWVVFAFLLNRWSLKQDQTGDPRLKSTLQRLSGPGLAVLFLTASFAAIDWVMTLQPDWYSTIFGPMVVTGQALATLAFMAATAYLLSKEPPLDRVARAPQFQDLGNLMLAFVMLWAYMSFSQYLIIWSGNLVEEIPWYLRRSRGGWQVIAAALIVVHFFLPFFVLLFRSNKRKGRNLLVVSAIILTMQWINLFWLIAPAPVFGRPRLGLNWLDLVVPVGIGGLWLATFTWQLKARPLLPLNDPRLIEALEHEHEHEGEAHDLDENEA